MNYLPLFCVLKQRRCLIVGGGQVAERKAKLLLDAEAELLIVAPTVTPQLQQWATEGRIQLILRTFHPNDIHDLWLVIAATPCHTTNQAVYDVATAQHIFCNVVDSTEQCSFIMPAVIRRDSVLVAVSSSATSPVLARLIREKIEQVLPQHLGQLVHLAVRFRAKVKQHLPQLTQRRSFWEKLFTHPEIEDQIQHADTTQQQQIVDQLLAESAALQGHIALVGAGPGDPKLLTLKALHYLQQADVVIYDRLVSEGVLACVRRDAEKIYVGKGLHCQVCTQDEINHQIVLHATQGKRVVRLKGGDPFIFGRGGEELSYITERCETPVTVVPGITSASGCAAYSGIPLTDREYAKSVSFITAYSKKGNAVIIPEVVTLDEHTWVFYMGLSQADYIQQTLLERGVASDTPIAIIENGTLPQQVVTTGVLSQLAQLALLRKSPSLIIIGHVVKRRFALHR